MERIRLEFWRSIWALQVGFRHQLPNRVAPFYQFVPFVGQASPETPKRASNKIKFWLVTSGSVKHKSCHCDVDHRYR